MTKILFILISEKFLSCFKHPFTFLMAIWEIIKLFVLLDEKYKASHFYQMCFLKYY